MQSTVPYLSEYMEAAVAKKVAQDFLDQSFQVTQNKEKEVIEEEEGEDLCDCTFSLAYGAKILLNNTRLRLKKGRRYGLCGPNGAGKVGQTSNLTCYARCPLPKCCLPKHATPTGQHATEICNGMSSVSLTN